MIRTIFRSTIWLLAILMTLFILPALAHLGVWSLKDKPSSWRHANWSSAGILAPATMVPEAKVYVFSARTGGLKGAFATHSWIVTKQADAARYNRYDVVGWGNPVRRNAYDADGRWYSNTPVIEKEISGREAAALIPGIERAIADYQWQKRGDYTIWPGPNSNTFVASIIRAVPGFDAATPSTAVGRDFPADGRWFSRTSDGGLRISMAGYIGMVAGPETGLELNFLGLVTGINPFSGEIKIPGFGTYRAL